ncbi:kinesin-like protein KIF23 [Dysidea avara]|uniref:kinesin-like protein KIF23 n=1 Tax=Dysidea avara TaxID=196820 RepID=UPI00332ADC53
MKQTPRPTPRSRTQKTPAAKRTHAKTEREQDPVQVYCRVRPLASEELETCVDVISDTVVQLVPPQTSLAFKSGHKNGTQHVFKHVFGPGASQENIFDSLGMPLVLDLLQGKNGLLFSYGITNGGKTFTVTGDHDNPGILPRALDVIFNSIDGAQAKKYVFKPDRTNGFDVQSEVDAIAEEELNRPKQLSAKARMQQAEFGDMLRPLVLDDCKEVVDNDSSYAVFVSYIEIYNNYIYDLLEDVPVDPIKPKPPQSKGLREDSSRNMYVSGATEVEVQTTTEAYEQLLKGQQRRRVAQTLLNTESSRSHSVFTIRIVQSPLDSAGDQVLQDKTKMTISQLSLVDLAGSERTSRTNNDGDRLREAGSINTSLMVLRTCLETLRDNQLQHGSNKIVPYRDSKLTLLFKRYFDGEGKVSMVVCLNPRGSDYDETIHVMRFAELTQEVAIDRATVNIAEHKEGLIPGRRLANLASRGMAEVDGPVVHPYKLALPPFSIEEFLSLEAIGRLRVMLEARSKQRQMLRAEQQQKMLQLQQLMELQDQQNSDLKGQVTRLSGDLSGRDKELSRLREESSRQISHLSHQLEEQRSQFGQIKKQNSRLQEELDRTMKKSKQLERTAQAYQHNQKELQEELTQGKQKMVSMQGFVSQEREKYEKMTKQLAKKNRLLYASDEKLRKVQAMVDHPPPSPGKTTESSNQPLNIPVRSNAHRKRSFSENWLDHRPTGSVESGTVLQPLIKRKKRTVAAPKSKDLGSAGRYCLTHQQQDTDGEIQTQLYKGSVFRTAGGGASVQFTAVETLRQQAADKATTPPPVAMEDDSSGSCDSTGSWTDVETRCAVAIENHPGSSPALTHAVVK